MSNIVNIGALAKRLKSLITSEDGDAERDSGTKQPNYTDFGWADVRTGTAKRAVPMLR